MPGKLKLLSAFCGIILLSMHFPIQAKAGQTSRTVTMPAIALPQSSFLEANDDAVPVRGANAQDALAFKACGDIDHASALQAPAIRECEIKAYYSSKNYEELYKKYPVKMAPEHIGGVYTEIFTPMDGVKPENANRVLINVHGGGFMESSRIESHKESAPIASIEKIKVISIDYRQAPEFAFPAASEDVAAVYRELLKQYKPQNIGIYGCSAGGLLTAEAIAWFEKEGLPLPGAIGMLCEGAGYWTEGDTGYIWGKSRLGGVIWSNASDNPYFKNVASDDPLAFPVRSPSVMSHFPPSLLISSTRDPALSSVVYTHSVLVNMGVPSELHVYEGFGHAFFIDVNLPQSQEVWKLTADFFDRNLGH